MIPIQQWDPEGEWLALGVPKDVRLDHTLLNAYFPHLYKLALSQCPATGDWLVDFLLRHKATLRRLAMSTMSLAMVRSSWRDVFTRISCQLPRLDQVDIHGGFHREYRHPIFFEHDSTESMAGRVTLQGDRHPTEESVRRRARQSEADEIDHYSLPCNLSNYQMLSDDLVLDYESDEYDDWLVC